MKMSEIFHLPVSFDVDLCKIHSPSHNLIEAKAINLEAQCYAINNHDRLTEENAKLRHELANLIYMAENNTGNEPSLSCFHLAIDEAKQLLINQLKDQNNDK